MSTLPKFESQVGGEWAPHIYPQVFVREQTKGPLRFKIAASKDGMALLSALSFVLNGPFAALYVLVVPRGGGNAGRYQSPWMDREQLQSLLDRFESYFEQDGRHDVWLFSDKEKATLVYDRHGVVFAYGPLDRFEHVLTEMGFLEAPILSVPVPHGHRYHAEFDDAERELTELPGWRHFPLQTADEC